MKHNLLFGYPILSNSWQDEARGSKFSLQEMLAFLSKLTFSTDEEVEVPLSKLLRLSQLAMIYQMLSHGLWLLTVVSPFYTLAQHFGPENPAESHEQQW